MATREWTVLCPRDGQSMGTQRGIIWCNMCAGASIFGRSFRCGKCCYEFCKDCKLKHDAILREQEKQKKEYELKARKIENERKAAQDKHKREMEQLKNAAKEKKREVLTATLKSYETEQKAYAKSKGEAEKELREAEEDVVLKQTKIVEFLAERDSKLAMIQTEIDKADIKYAGSDKKIQDAISLTNVDEGNIPKFLRLVNDGLLFATLSGQEQTDKLSAKLKVFSELIERQCQSKLSIRMFFKDNNLERFTPILAKEDFSDMNEIVCDGEEEYDELREMLIDGLKEVAALESNEKKRAKLSKMSFKEKKSFKKFCYRNTAEKTWIPEQNKKIKITRKSLLETSPKLANFFGLMYGAMDEVTQILSYNKNEAQQKAIEAAPLIIEEVKTEEKKEQIEDALMSLVKGSQCEIFSESQQKWYKGEVIEIVNDTEGEWLKVQYVAGDEGNKHKQVQRMNEQIKPIVSENPTDDDTQAQFTTRRPPTLAPIDDETKTESKEESKETAPIIEEVTDDAKDESKENVPVIEEVDEEEYKRAQEHLAKKQVAKMEFKEDRMNSVQDTCNKLNAVAISKLHVVDTVRDQFVSEQFPLVYASALTVADNVENCCMEIIRTQCVIRQSVLLARQLLSYKPAAPSEDAVPLWEVVTDGITNIFKNALEMSRISSSYFGYFVKFKLSFEKFMAAHEIDPSVSLLVAMEHVIKDVEDFQVFQKQIDATVKELRQVAEKTIEDCVKKTAGATEFDTAMKKRKEAEVELKGAKQRYHELKFKLEDTYETLRVQKGKLSALIKGKQAEKESLQKTMTQHAQYIDELKNKLKAIA